MPRYSCRPHRPAGDRDRLDELARRLKAVLDRHLAIHLDQLSPRTVGDTIDGLNEDREDIGVIPTADLGTPAVRFVRVASPSSRWVLSPRTVEHVDTW